jgi:type VI secretion system protein ImpK
MQAEGRADTETLASNETPQGRADNRRVEINLFITQ